MPLDPDWTVRLAQASASEDPGRARAGVAVVVHEPVPGLPRVLLMKRTEHPHDPWSGQVSLPGGRVDPGDQGSLAAARRETLEELGVDLVRDARLVGPLPPVAATARGRRVDLLVHPWVWRLEREVPLVPNEEAEEGFWLPLADTVAGALDHVHRVERGGLVHRRPAWLVPAGVRAHVVWGLTYEIVGRFLELARRPGP